MILIFQGRRTSATRGTATGWRRAATATTTRGGRCACAWSSTNMAAPRAPPTPTPTDQSAIWAATAAPAAAPTTTTTPAAAAAASAAATTTARAAAPRPAPPATPTTGATATKCSSNWTPRGGTRGGEGRRSKSADSPPAGWCPQPRRPWRRPSTYDNNVPAPRSAQGFERRAFFNGGDEHFCVRRGWKLILGRLGGERVK